MPSVRRDYRAGFLPEDRGFPSAKLPPAMAGQWVLIWDGACAFCRRWVQSAMSRRAEPRLLEISYQDARSWLPAEVLARAPYQAWLRAPDGRYWGGGDILPHLLRLWGHPLAAAILDLPGMRQAVAVGYRIVARNRTLLSRLSR